MPQHKFLNVDFGQLYPNIDSAEGFATENAILKTTPYKPEVLFIGTFNHGWHWNDADFFYGRGMFMWPILANLFCYNNNQLIQARNANNNNPNLDEIFKICKKSKIAFADIVKGLKKNVNYIVNQNQKCVLVENQYCWNDYKDRHLDNLGAANYLEDNVKEIIEFIKKTPSIKHVYFTFKSGDWVVNKKDEIIQGINLIQNRAIDCGSIFTPTASGFGQTLQAPFNQRAWSLAHCWVWNGMPNQVPINRLQYTHFNHNWLQNCNVIPNNF